MEVTGVQEPIAASRDKLTSEQGSPQGQHTRISQPGMERVKRAVALPGMLEVWLILIRKLNHCLARTGCYHPRQRR